MIEPAVRTLLVIVGIGNLAPGIVAVAPARAATLYGVTDAGPDLLLLLRHRAVLLALVGSGVIVAAFVPSIRPVTTIAAAVSMASFLALAVPIGRLNHRNRRIAAIDIGGLVVLAAAVALDLVA